MRDFFSQALLGILRKLVVADPHLLPPDAKPSGGADHQLRWGGALEYVFCMKRNHPRRKAMRARKNRNNNKKNGNTCNTEMDCMGIGTTYPTCHVFTLFQVYWLHLAIP